MIGKTILHYKILAKLGEGGMGVVYKAEDTKLKRIVAIKFLPRQIAASDDERERFKIEAQAAAALNHPNIATIHAIEEVDKEMFIVMEFIDGKSIEDMIVGATDRSPLPLNDAINYATQIAAGLQAAHTKGIIHRDIKSSNIMVTASGQVKIMDFGLAKLASQEARFTKTGATVGTPAYMSPEQIQGLDVDSRSDLWSFGVVLYEMLTRQLPFRGEYETAIMYSILHENPEISDQIPADFQPLIKRALAKDPTKRPQTAAEITEALGAIGAEQPTPRKKVAQRAGFSGVLTAAVIVVLVAASIYLFRSAPASKLPEALIKTIAVLPFTDMSPNQDQEYLSDGIAEELSNVLAKNPKLSVTSRTSAFSFKGKGTDIKTIAAKLQVKHILEGSVRKSGNQIRIAAQLIDVDTDTQLWSQIYDDNLNDIFAVQEKISLSVAAALQATLLNGTAPQRETDPQAYNAYLQGKHFGSFYTKENWEKAIGYLEQALALDPEFAPAWLTLSFVHTAQADFTYIPLDEGYRRARQEAAKALELDPGLGAAHARLAWIKRSYDWDWKGADESYRRALALEPGNASILSGAAGLAATLGRFEEALTLSRRATELNPISALTYHNLGFHALYAGQLAEAETAFQKALELKSGYPKAHMYIGRVCLEKGEADSARMRMEQENEPFWRSYGLLLANEALGGEEQDGTALQQFIKENQYDSGFQIAEIYAYRGDADAAFAWLERAYKQRDGGLTEIKGDPLLRGIEADPRYEAFLEKMKLPL